LFNFLYNLKNLLNYQRCKSERRFIEKQQAGSGHQSAGDGKHLLFASAECSALLVSPFRQSGEKIIYLLKVFPDSVSVLSQESPEVKVLRNCEVRENMPPLRNLTNAHLDYFIRLHPVYRFALEKDFALLGLNYAAH